MESDDKIDLDSKCGSKFKYKSQRDAAVSLKNSFRSEQRTRRLLNIYHCEVCSFYHIGATFKQKDALKKEKEVKKQNKYNEQILNAFMNFKNQEI